MKKIVVIGGTGLLGSSMKKINNDIICFGSEKDIFDFKVLEIELNKINPDVIINAAGIKTKEVLTNKENAINVNIIGSANISKYCIKNNIKLVYISTDYIYPGTFGDYKETDPIFPENIYAWTKLSGEGPTRLVSNHLIVRTSFGSEKFPYDSAYDNLYVSKDYVDIISKKILDVIETDYVGVLNIGTEKKTMFEYAIQKNVVNKSSLFKTKDFSLNTELYDVLIKEIENKNKYKYNSICPISHRTEKIKYFDLGNMPIVNNLCETFDKSINCDKFPLSISLFKESGLSALDIIVNPDDVFLDYSYRSNTNKPYFDHCKSMYKYLSLYISLKAEDLCVDIGGNDGTLLMAFDEISNELKMPLCEKINIEPSKNISEYSIKNKLTTINEYFAVDVAKKINKKSKVITTTNVFQHLLDIQGFLDGINELLDDNGVWCLEFPYWLNNMETHQFDQVYHEHIYYYMITPLYNFFKQNKLRIVNISEHYIHGGSLRLIITKEKSEIKSDNTIDYFLTKEKKYDENYYLNWSITVDQHLIQCEKILKSIKGNIVGFGAAAKGCIFLNKLKIDYNKIKYVIDDTIIKQGKYIPGTGIEIVSRDIIKTENIDFILILSHNFAEYIIESLRKFGYTGKFILLLPDIKIIN